MNYASWLLNMQIQLYFYKYIFIMIYQIYDTSHLTLGTLKFYIASEHMNGHLSDYINQNYL
jgi:hypothetical protein